MNVTSKNSDVGRPPVADASTNATPVNKPEGYGVRHVQTFLMFLGLTVGYILRVNISVAIVAMADSSTANPDFEDFDWDPSAQSWILSTFLWGYLVAQVPASQVAHMWSASKLWSIGMCMCGVFNILIPFAASYGGYIAVCICRVIMGFTQGCMIPCVHTLLGKWAPPVERARLGTYSYAGAQAGTVIGLPFSGLLAASSIGWPSVFYISGAATIAWAICFFIWGSDSPAKHRSITVAERDYIEQSLRQFEVQKRPPTPWKHIALSLPLWSLVVAHCGNTWGTWTLLTEIPTYMKNMLMFDISQNGFISALPYLAMWILSFPMGWFSDYVVRRGWVSRAVSRKVSNTIGYWGPAIFLVALGFASVENTTIIIIILTFAVGLNAGSLSGYQINHIDLSPTFAGTLVSITNCIASIMGLIAPLVAGVVITDQSNTSQWQLFFLIAAVIYFFTNLFWIIFGKAEVQPWNDLGEESETDSEFGHNQGTKKSKDEFVEK